MYLAIVGILSCYVWKKFWNEHIWCRASNYCCSYADFSSWFCCSVNNIMINRYFPRILFICKYRWNSAYCTVKECICSGEQSTTAKWVSYAQKLRQWHGLWRHKCPIDTAFDIWSFVIKQNKGLLCFPESVHWTSGRDALKLRAVCSVRSVYTLFKHFGTMVPKNICSIRSEMNQIIIE